MEKFSLQSIQSRFFANPQKIKRPWKLQEVPTAFDFGIFPLPAAGKPLPMALPPPPNDHWNNSWIHEFSASIYNLEKGNACFY